jgi:hypothetical protein
MVEISKLAMWKDKGQKKCGPLFSRAGVFVRLSTSSFKAIYV